MKKHIHCPFVCNEVISSRVQASCPKKTQCSRVEITLSYDQGRDNSYITPFTLTYQVFNK